MAQNGRNGYIDVIKFFFSLVILEFHLNTGLFPGGRMAVEGFFMISSYLMMGYIERGKDSGDNLGISSVRFLWRKYKGLFPFLLPSAILGYIIYSIKDGRSLAAFLYRMPLLLFDLFPLRDAGFRGSYVLGISWYLSAMFLSLAILYPLCKKYATTFTLTVCPLFVFLIYGYLSHTFGHLAVASTYIEGLPINAGLLRGLAGSSLGCLLYESCKRISGRQLTPMGKTVFTAAELLGFLYFLYAMHFHPKSQYDYVLVFVIFGLLVIGISGLSAASKLWDPRWTKPLGTWSTLIVLNHCCWRDYLPQRFGPDYTTTGKAWIYYAAVGCSCIAVYFMSKAVRLLMKKFSHYSLSNST